MRTSDFPFSYAGYNSIVRVDLYVVGRVFDFLAYFVYSEIDDVVKQGPVFLYIDFLFGYCPVNILEPFYRFWESESQSDNQTGLSIFAGSP